MFHFSYYLSKLSILTLIFFDFKYFFTCLIVSSLKWKTDAANTAEAPPNLIPSKKSFKQPTPPEAITGIFTALEILDVNSKSNPFFVPSYPWR